MIKFEIGKVYKNSKKFIGYLTPDNSESVVIKQGSLLTCVELKKEKKHKPWDAKYFLFDNKIIRISWHSYQVLDEESQVLVGECIIRGFSNKKKFKKLSENSDFFSQYWEEVPLD